MWMWHTYCFPFLASISSPTLSAFDKADSTSGLSKDGRCYLQALFRSYKTWGQCQSETVLPSCHHEWNGANLEEAELRYGKRKLEPLDQSWPDASPIPAPFQHTSQLIPFLLKIICIGVLVSCKQRIPSGLSREFSSIQKHKGPCPQGTYNLIVKTWSKYIIHFQKIHNYLPIT